MAFTATVKSVVNEQNGFRVAIETRGTALGGALTIDPVVTAFSVTDAPEEARKKLVQFAQDIIAALSQPGSLR